MTMLPPPNLAVISTLSVIILCPLFSGEDRRSALARKDMKHLSPLQGFVGHWRGSGFERRGSTKGAWREDSTWAWKFIDGRAFLVFDAPRGRFLRKGRLGPGEKPGHFQLQAELANPGGTIQYQGIREKSGRIVFESRSPAPGGAPARVYFSLLAEGKRLSTLLEGKNAASGRHYRLGEVGYTRSGESISKGSGQPECIVTGGRGTIRVEHKGKSYTVCCKGCLEAFKEDPAGIIAEWSQRKKPPPHRKKAKDKTDTQ